MGKRQTTKDGDAEFVSMRSPSRRPEGAQTGAASVDREGEGGHDTG